MGSEASTAKARTADGAKKKALQKPKQQQTPVNHSNMFFMKHEILIVLANIFVQRSIARMGSEASTAKARTADGAKKKALQKPKQQQTPVNHSNMFFMKHEILIVLANIFVQRSIARMGSEAKCSS
jgi:hypothetical protein